MAINMSYKGAQIDHKTPISGLGTQMKSRNAIELFLARSTVFSACLTAIFRNIDNI